MSILYLIPSDVIAVITILKVEQNSWSIMMLILLLLSLLLFMFRIDVLIVFLINVVSIGVVSDCFLIKLLIVLVACGPFPDCCCCWCLF